MQKNIQLSLILVALFSSANADNTIELEPITVSTVSNTKQSIKDVTSNVNVITSDETEARHYTTVTEALNSISGISFTQNGGIGGSTKVQVRGMESKRVLVLIDGVRYNNPTDTIYGSPFAHLMINNIEQIEIVKGAQSGVWGADASAGVINIITKDAKKGLNGFVNAELGSFSTKKYGGGASYKEDNYYFKTSIQKVDTGGFTAVAPKGDDINQYEDDGYRNTTSNLKLGFNINDTNKVDISHIIVNAHSDYDGSSTPDAYKNYRSDNSFTNINYNHIDSFNELSIHANRSTFDRDYSNGNRYNAEVYEYGIKSNISYGDKDFVLVGLDYKNFETTSYGSSQLNKNYENKAIFLNNSNYFNNNKTVISEAIRFDIYNTFDNKTTGKIGIQHNFDNSFIATANVGTAYNVPTASQLYGKPTYKTVNPESTTSYDISLSYRDLKLTYFTYKIEDMITYKNATDGYENRSGESKIKGFESEYSLNLNDDIYLTANYTRLSAKDNDNEELKRRPKDSLKFGADYYGINGLHLGINGEYVGSRFNSDNKQGEQTGKYTLVNAVANYDINKNTLIYIKVDNLFDKYYQVVDGYATAPLSAYVGLTVKF